MTKMPKMQNIPNLHLLVCRDHQLVYFTMFHPSIVLNVEFQNGKHENLWFETQQNFKLFIIFILISNNCFSFIV